MVIAGWFMWRWVCFAFSVASGTGCYVGVDLAPGGASTSEQDPHTSTSSSTDSGTTLAPDPSTTGSATETEGVVSASGEGSSSSTSSNIVEETDTSSSSGEPESTCPTDSDVIALTPLDPVETGAQITEGFMHFYAEPAGRSRGELLVFLPGSNGPPSNHQLFLQLAAAGGYHTLGLSYRNEVNIRDACVDQPAGCQIDLRREILYGLDTSNLIDVPPPDSVVNRVIRALEHIGWDEYLGDVTLDWSAIAFAGHSQGGGHAAVVAQDHPVARAVMIAATESADWTEQPMTTATDNLFAFVHEDDANYTGILASWTNLGVPGDPHQHRRPSAPLRLAPAGHVAAPRRRQPARVPHRRRRGAHGQRRHPGLPAGVV